MRSGIMRSFFLSFPSDDRVGGRNGRRLRQELNIIRERERGRKHKSNIEGEKRQLRHKNVISLYLSTSVQHKTCLFFSFGRLFLLY